MNLGTIKHQFNKKNKRKKRKKNYIQMETEFSKTRRPEVMDGLD